MRPEKLYPAYNGSIHQTEQQTLGRGVWNCQNFIVLCLTSFLIPGMGLAADGCMSQIVAAISSMGNALKVISKHCERIQCKNCYQWWISKRTFDLAVQIECYAKFIKDRPAGVVCSVHPDQVGMWSWLDYGKFMRRCYNRLYTVGVTGGVRIFHPFRVKAGIKSALRERGAKDSGGFWKMIRENVLNLPSWYSYVSLAPHVHCIVFPSFLGANTKKDIIIKKYSVFETPLETVKHIRYLLSHCGILTDGGNEPAAAFGALHGWKPEDNLTWDQILCVKKEVADAMGLVYDEDSDSIKPEDSEDDHKYAWIPMHEFANYSCEQDQFIGAFVGGIWDDSHRSFVDRVISLYNERRNDTNLTKDKRHVFLEDIENEIPDGFEVVIMDRDHDKA